MSPRRRFAKRLCAASMVVVAILLVIYLPGYLNSYNVRQQLIGQWTFERKAADGSPELYVFGLRGNGSVAFYPFSSIAAEAEIEPEDIDSAMRWHVVDGNLILTWDHEFPSNASLIQRLCQIVSQTVDRWNGQQRLSRYSQSCGVTFQKGEATIVPLSDTRYPDQFVGAPLKLKRIQGFK